MFLKGTGYTLYFLSYLTRETILVTSYLPLCTSGPFLKGVYFLFKGSKQKQFWQLPSPESASIPFNFVHFFTFLLEKAILSSAIWTYQNSR